MDNLTDKVKKALSSGERVVIDIRRGKDIEVTVGDDCGYEHMDVEELTLDQLQEHLDQLEEHLAELDEKEPSDMSSEEYDEWADEHEEVEDRIDEVIDRLEELRG